MLDVMTTVDGGYREDLTVELWIVPTGATPPTAAPTRDVHRVRKCQARSASSADGDE